MLHVTYALHCNTGHVRMYFWLGLQYVANQYAFAQLCLFIFYFSNSLIKCSASVCYISNCTLSFLSCDRNALSQLHSKKCSTPQVFRLIYIVLLCMLIWLENVFSGDGFLFHPASILDIDTLKIPNKFSWMFRYYDKVFHVGDTRVKDFHKLCKYL
jgi:hypothetical protein